MTIRVENSAKGETVRRVPGRLEPDGVRDTGPAESPSNLGLPVRLPATAVHTHA
ncbi:MAG: hypothetical protein V4795_05020 [Pseudomonadota bacterium]